RRRRDSRSTSAGRTGGWPRCGCTTTWRRRPGGTDVFCVACVFCVLRRGDSGGGGWSISVYLLITPNGATIVNIADKTILITGANRGIGQALVTEALARGAARVYAGTRGPLTPPDPRVTPVTLEVTDAAQVQAAARDIGALDILVNNAGIA